MEFEILDNPEFPPGPFESVRRFLLNPRRQMQAWGDRVPGFAAGAVAALVVVEWVLAGRIAGGHGPGLSTLVEAGVVAAVIVGAAALLASSGAGIAALVGKAGSRKTALGYLFLGLSPLLMVLPVTLLCEAARTPAVVRLVVVALLFVKVAGLWREALEVTFKLNRLQSAVSMYAAVSGGVGLIFLVIYATALGRIASVLN